MKHKFFKVPVADPVNGETELNAFMSQHRIAHIDRNNNTGFRLAPAQQAMIGLNDPIIIRSCHNASKQQDRRYVSNDCGCYMNACRTVASFQGGPQNLTQTIR